MSCAYDPSGLTLPNAHIIGGEYVGGPAALNVVSPSTGAIIGKSPAPERMLSTEPFRPPALRWRRRTGAGCNPATAPAPCAHGPI